MYVDVGALFDQIFGHELFNLSEVVAVVSDKVKCADGTVLEFLEDVDGQICEGDDILVLRQRLARKELEEVRESMRCKNDWSLDDVLTQQIAEAEREGFSISYSAVVNDEIYPLLDFKF